ncbi:hypothetical protein [Umezawaea tangerina]|uniref:Uncharacterized protein n=1 Tax=Umezawaea tangerina TaxID=84725 RepID=A0A2T0SQ98_9PSEU|nr:hypothetical protein [Umezawaea tangerina]PRY35580.1 hypothetical protein CLV43_1137 [Umezawaea tangerina]
MTGSRADRADPSYLAGVDVRHSPCGSSWDHTDTRSDTRGDKAGLPTRTAPTVHSGPEPPPRAKAVHEALDRTLPNG